MSFGRPDFPLRCVLNFDRARDGEVSLPFPIPAVCRPRGVRTLIRIIVAGVLILVSGCIAESGDQLYWARLVATGTPAEFAALKNEAKFKEIASFTYGRGQNLAHAAVENKKYPEVLMLLADAGVDLDRQDADGRTPLHHAIDADRLEGARILIDLGASLTLENEAGFSPIRFCKDALRSLPGHRTCQLVLQAASAKVD